ncbi:hypothetical protein [Nocardia sp. NPDC004722]
MPRSCPWCTDNGPEDPDPDLLCASHYAEFEGSSVAGIERRDREQYAEWFDATHG